MIEATNIIIGNIVEDKHRVWYNKVVKPILIFDEYIIKRNVVLMTKK